jgi:hypothetical protein
MVSSSPSGAAGAKLGNAPVGFLLPQTRETDTIRYSRLNTKIESRGVEVKDLVADLSDGVSVPLDTWISNWVSNITPETIY